MNQIDREQWRIDLDVLWAKSFRQVDDVNGADYDSLTSLIQKAIYQDHSSLIKQIEEMKKEKGDPIKGVIEQGYDRDIVSCGYSDALIYNQALTDISTLLKEKK